MMKLQSGDILFSYANHPLSWLIRKITGCNYSHTEVILNDGGVLYAVGAKQNGITEKSLINYISTKKTICVKRHIKWISNEMTNLEIEQYNSRIKSKIHIRYDFESLLFYQLIYNLFGKWVGKANDNAENKFYCSEFAAWVNNINNWWMKSPASLYNDNSFYKIFEGDSKQLISMIKP